MRLQMTGFLDNKDFLIGGGALNYHFELLEH